MPEEHQKDDSSTYRETLTNLKHSIVEKYNWTLFDIDETDISNLLTFISHKSKPNQNTRIINGKTYKRATKPPSWL
jgi:hypothetical protein